MISDYEDKYQYSMALLLKRNTQAAKIYKPSWVEVLANSLDCDDDEYDSRGRNISAQERRQELYPWFTIDRGNLATDVK